MMESCDELRASPESSSLSSSYEEGKRSCVNCGTTKTPLWRGGPAGPKSLCNACGIRTRKKRQSIKAANADNKKKSGKGCSKLARSLRESFGVLRREGLMRGWREPGDHEFGEAEQAAVLLMALSCGGGGGTMYA